MKIKTSLLLGLAAIAISFLAVRFFFTPQGFTFHDETQIVNLYEYFKALDHGQFPPRWAPDVHFGYGSPFLEFNYQLPYYLGYPLHLLGVSLTQILKILLGFSVLAGALGMYLLGLHLASPGAALVAAVLYTYTPYRAVDVFVRGTLGEAYALALFPWLFLAYLRFQTRPSLARLLPAGALFGLFLINHQIAFLFGFAVLLALFAVPALVKRQGHFLFRLVISFLVGLALAAYYALPVLLEKKFIQSGSPFDFYVHFPFIKQLIYSPWGYLASVEGIYDGLSFQVGLPNLAIILLAVLLFIARLIRRRPIPLVPLFTLGTIFISFFLMNIRSSFFWRVFPFTSEVQFPWRLLLIATWLTPLLYLYLHQFLPRWGKVAFGLLIASTAFIIVLPYYHPGELADHYDAYYLRRFLPKAVLLPGETISADYLKHTEDYLPLPKGAVRPAASLPQPLVSLYDSRLEVTSASPFKLKAKVTASQPDTLTFSAFAYPGWQVKLNSQPSNASTNLDGALTFAVPAGQTQVEVFFSETPVRRFSNIISLGSFILLLQYFIYYLWRHVPHPFTRSK